MKGASVQNAWNPPADVFIDTIDKLLHHKYFITDANSSSGNKITVTGSFNWEPDASLWNDENTLVISVQGSITFITRNSISVTGNRAE